MGLRNEWKFRYSQSEMQDAAQKRADYHQEREKHYRSQQEEAETELQAAGVKLTEQAVTGGKRFYAQADPVIMERYSVAFDKAESHRQKAEEFERWVRALGHQEEGAATYLDLDVSDIHYFNL